MAKGSPELKNYFSLYHFLDVFVGNCFSRQTAVVSLVFQQSVSALLLYGSGLISRGKFPGGALSFFVC